MSPSLPSPRSRTTISSPPSPRHHHPRHHPSQPPQRTPLSPHHHFVTLHLRNTTSSPHPDFTLPPRPSPLRYHHSRCHHLTATTSTELYCHPITTKTSAFGSGFLHHKGAFGL
ncbi:hypothetical protein Tco_1430522 [Tanacetum coccineum]